MSGIISIFLLILFLIGLGIHKIKQKNRPDHNPANTGVVYTEEDIKQKPKPVYKPVREIPEKFRRDTHLPTAPEGETSDRRNAELFSPGRDLIYFDDKRVVWESDNDKNDIECDHSMHKSMEKPLRLLIELVCARGGTLEVQDSYRPIGIHNPRSLHKEGRAIDLTCDELGLEQLACLCWGAGFDWVYYEASSRGGAHVHCSVKRNHVQPK